MTTATETIAFSATLSIEAAGAKPARVSILAYTGGPLMLGNFRSPVIVDLDGLEIAAQLPLLANHQNDTQAVVGFGEPVIRGGQIFVAGVLHDETDAGKQIIAMGRKGQPWQASIGAEPLRFETVRAGDVVSVNGREFKADRRGLMVARQSRLIEVSIVPVGADRGGTAVSIAAKQGTSMTTETAETEAAPEISEQRQRLNRIEAICQPPEGGWGSLEDKVTDLRLQAASGELPVEELGEKILGFMRGREDLERMRASRPKASGPAKGESTPNSDKLAAGLLIRAGLSGAAVKAYGEGVANQAESYSQLSFPDMIRAAMRDAGVPVPHDRGELINASLGVSTLSLPTVMGDAMNKALLMFYREQPATWRRFAAVRRAKDFRDNKSLRPSFVGELEEIAPDGELKHGSMKEETVINWSVDTFGKIFSVTRKDIINDDLSFLDEAPPLMAQAAARRLNDLFWQTVLANAGGHWSAGNNNLLTGASSALDAGGSGLQDAVTLLRKMTDSNGNNIEVDPLTLVIPPELEVAARSLLESTEVARDVSTNDRQPTGNVHRNAAALEIEPRLSGSKFSGTSATHWYLFGNPMLVPAIVGYLEGKTAPTIEVFDMKTDPNKLAMGYRVYHDFGVALGDKVASIRSAGA